MGKERVMRLHCLVLLAALAMSLTTKARAGSSNSLLDVSPDGSLLLVANPDNGTVTVVDTLTRKSIHEIEVGDGRQPLGHAQVLRPGKYQLFGIRIREGSDQYGIDQAVDYGRRGDAQGKSG